MIFFLSFPSLYARALDSSFTQENLDLNTSLVRAMANNPRLLGAQKELAIADTQVRQAKSLYYPKVGLNLNYIRYRNETLGVTPEELGGVVLEAPIPTSTGERGNPLADNLYVGRLGFRQTLYAGGKLNYTNKLSQANRRRAQSSYESLKHTVEYETTKAFVDLVSLQIKDELIQFTLAEIADLQKEVRDGYDELMMKTTQMDLRKRSSDIHQKKEQAKLEYCESMGMEFFSEVRAQGSLDLPPLSDTFQTILVRAKQNRSELKETLIQEELDQLSVHLSMSERYPVFLLGGGVELRNDTLPLEEYNWNAVLSMNIPLFDGFSSWARVRESRYRADQGRLHRVQLQDQVEREVRLAHNDYLHWKDELLIREQELENLGQTRKKIFDAKGSRLLAEKLDTWRWKLDAKIDIVDAKYELCLAQARLARATGRTILEP